MIDFLLLKIIVIFDVERNELVAWMNVWNAAQCHGRLRPHLHIGLNWVGMLLQECVLQKEGKSCRQAANRCPLGGEIRSTDFLLGRRHHCSAACGVPPGDINYF